MAAQYMPPGGGGGGGAPSGPAGGVLGGTYPNPAFALDMATQAELDAETAARVAADSAEATTRAGAVSAEIAARSAADSTHAALTTGAHGGVVAASDGRLSDPRTPTTHASTHAAAGSDPVTPVAIGAAATSHTHVEADVTSLVADLALKAPLVSPALTGNPTVPTQTAGNNSTRAASTAYADAAVAVEAAARTTADAALVPSTRTVSAGTGLTGGGDLTANRTLAPDFGTGAGKVTQGNDSRLSDARTPTAHASTHAPGGTDPVPTVGFGCWMYRSAAQSLPSGFITTVSLDATQFNDSASYYTLSGGKIVVVQAGLYVVTASCVISGGSTGGRSVQINLNGAVVADFGLGGLPGLASTVSQVLRLAAADQVSLSMYIDGGSSASCDVSAPRNNSMRVARIGS